MKTYYFSPQQYYQYCQSENTLHQLPLSGTHHHLQQHHCWQLQQLSHSLAQLQRSLQTTLLPNQARPSHHLPSLPLECLPNPKLRLLVVLLSNVEDYGGCLQVLQLALGNLPPREYLQAQSAFSEGCQIGCLASLLPDLPSLPHAGSNSKQGKSVLCDPDNQTVGAVSKDENFTPGLLVDSAVLSQLLQGHPAGSFLQNPKVGVFPIVCKLVALDGLHFVYKAGGGLCLKATDDEVEVAMEDLADGQVGLQLLSDCFQLGLCYLYQQCLGRWPFLVPQMIREAVVLFQYIVILHQVAVVASPLLLPLVVIALTNGDALLDVGQHERIQGQADGVVDHNADHLFQSSLSGLTAKDSSLGRWQLDSSCQDEEGSRGHLEDDSDAQMVIEEGSGRLARVGPESHLEGLEEGQFHGGFSQIKRFRNDQQQLLLKMNGSPFRNGQLPLLTTQDLFTPARRPTARHCQADRKPPADCWPSNLSAISRDLFGRMDSGCHKNAERLNARLFR